MPTARTIRLTRMMKFTSSLLVEPGHPSIPATRREPWAGRRCFSFGLFARSCRDEGCLRLGRNTFLGGAPLPVPNLRQILAVLIDVLLVLDELVPDHLLQIGAPGAQVRHAIHHVLHQMETIEVVLHPHVKRRRDGAERPRSFP